LLLFFFLVICFLSFINIYNNFYFQPTYKNKPPDSKEEFKPELCVIYNVKTLTRYVDSLYGGVEIQKEDSLRYANLMAQTVRYRFYHGLSHYSWKENWILYLLNPIHPHALAIVKPNDILKHSEALCSQQAIVAMIALRNKGFNYRKVGFYDEKRKGGHFTYEIRLNNEWHFFDVNLEPDFDLLVRHNRPSIEFLSQNDSLREAVYSKFDTNIKVDLLKSYNNDYPINEFPAKNMLWFHEFTRMMSYWLWLVFPIIFLFVRKYKAR